MDRRRKQLSDTPVIGGAGLDAAAHRLSIVLDIIIQYKEINQNVHRYT